MLNQTQRRQVLACGLLVLAGAAHAAGEKYWMMKPISVPKAAQEVVLEPEVELAAAQLPGGLEGQAYSYDLKGLTQVTGGPGLQGVLYSVGGGALPGISWQWGGLGETPAGRGKTTQTARRSPPHQNPEALRAWWPAATRRNEPSAHARAWP